MREYWALKCENGEFMRAADCAGDPFLAFFSKQDAEVSAESHKLLWDIRATPVRLNPEEVAG